MSLQAKSQAPTHSCVFYDDSAERADLLVDYFREGLDAHELCVLVTHELPEEVLENFAARGLNLKKSLERGDLKIFEMDITYLPNGEFVADFMRSNVESFLEEARSQGYTGLRTAGEMSWLTTHPEAVEEAVTYESDVNNISLPGVNFTGICLYPVANSFSNIVSGALLTHPTYLKDGAVHPNQYFKPALH